MLFPGSSWPPSRCWPGRREVQNLALPIEVTADHIEYLQNVEMYEAEGHAVIVQGQTRLTADHVTLMMLSGTVIAEGHVHLTDPASDTEAERLELDMMPKQVCLPMDGCSSSNRTLS